jgi:predicted methyltransferase
VELRKLFVIFGSAALRKASLRSAFSIMVCLASLSAVSAADANGSSADVSAIKAAVESPRRSAKNVARDFYRHPVETLTFFGVRPDETVVEIWPGNGWYAEILAPLLRDHGKYIVALPLGKGHDAITALFAKDPARFSGAIVTALATGKTSDIAPAGSADVVLTFRNVHNFLKAGTAASAQFFADCYRALKPGGVLGIEDHRLPENEASELEISSGYIKRSTVIRLAEAAGFKFDGESQINNNPKDDHHHPKGVWTLPPTYALGGIDHAKYEAIGESDRFTLRFIKSR